MSKTTDELRDIATAITATALAEFKAADVSAVEMLMVAGVVNGILTSAAANELFNNVAVASDE